MTTAAEELTGVVAQNLPKLRTLSEEEVMRSRGTGKWVKKEILGHLIDSAVNNHQRFVRAQLSGRLVWPGYEQDRWVAVQKYRERSWAEIVILWEQLNRHLAHVMANVPAERLGTKCVIGEGEPVTLEWLMSDYVRHLRHHLDQILR
ncbi:MAG TPA: DinB family protein [Candidatus Acidoferrales bacterium]|nr:DinB family protein [Candidatus Acidoferrales bacterium]